MIRVRNRRRDSMRRLQRRLTRGPSCEAPSRARRGLACAAAFLGITAVTVTAALLAIDVGLAGLSAHAHAKLSALPLALVALAYMAHQPLRRPNPLAIVKSALLASAFLLWAAYQLSPTLPITVNDLAITLFILDLALVIGTDLRRDRTSRSPTPAPIRHSTHPPQNT
jgi:hypothetical protein